MRKRWHPDDGGTLIELVFALAILMTVLIGFQTMLVGSLRSYGSSRHRTIATQIANDEIESARRLTWDQLGTVGGAAPGILPSTKAVVKNAVSFTVGTVVEFIDDPVDPTFSVGSNYKRVVITVAGPPKVGAPVTLETFVAPPTQPSRSKGAIKVDIIEVATNTPIAGATVALLDGPSAPRSGPTNAAGKLSFGDLTPTTPTGTTSKYRVDGSKAGYLRVPEDDPTQSNMTTTLDPSQVWPTVVHLFRPVSLEIDVVDWLNRPVTTGASIIVTPQASTAQGFALPPSGHLSISTVNSLSVRPDKTYTVAPAIPGQTITPITQLGAPAYTAGNYTSSFRFQLAPPPSVSQKINVVTSAGLPVGLGTPITLTGGPSGVSLSGATNALGVVNFSVVPDPYIVYVVHAVAGATWSATDAPITVVTPQTALTAFTFTLAPPPAPAPVDQIITVLSPAGVPVGNSVVTLTGGPGAVSRSGTTAALTGVVTFSGVVPDAAIPYVVHVAAAPGWAAADKPILVAAPSLPYVLPLVAP